jgi:hypothetical protein
VPYVSRYRKSEECLKQPDDGNLSIWRYLDLPRLVWILSNHQLPFVRIGLFSDPFEGAVPEWYDIDDPERTAHDQVRSLIRNQMFVSCWYADPDESEAMWRLYCGEGNGVALRTTYEALDASLPPEVQLGMVDYMEQDEWPKGHRDAYAPMIRKRRSFRHEHEVRAIFFNGRALLVRDETEPSKSRWAERPDVVAFPWNIAAVVQRIYVSPYSQPWFEQVVRSVVAAFEPELAGRLCWSSMKRAPRY